METFENISWNVPVELDTDFTSAEEFRSKSLTYKILHGSFKAELSSDSSDEPMYEKAAVTKKNAKKKKKKGKKNKETVNKSKLKEPMNNVTEEHAFDEDGVRCSAFSAAQHAAFVDMLLSVQNQRISIPPEWTEMKQAVEKEQVEFLEHIKEIWKTSYEKHHVLVPDAQRFIEDHWKSKLKSVRLYPQFYASLRKIPLVYPADKPEVQMVPLQMLLEKGVVPRFHVPNNNVTTKICTDYSTMLRLNAPSPDDVNTLLHLPVSCDKNAEILAVKERADIVISSSSLKCLANNVSSKFDHIWNIPVKVKQYRIKDGSSLRTHKVVFIDKRLPSKNMSASERNAWFHKLAVKCLMCNHRDLEAFRYSDDQTIDLNVEFSDEENVKEHQNEQDKKTIDNCDKCKSSRNEEHLNNWFDDSSQSSDLVIDEDAFSDNKTCSCKSKLDIVKEIVSSPSIQNDIECTVIPPSSKTNVTYRLWKLNCEERCKEELNEKFLKGQSSPKELRVLVRCKMDACERENSQVVPVCINCKLEYQTEHGVEKINLSTLVREWVSLFFRPEANLRRIRVDALTEEVIMTETVLLRDLAVMASHLHNVSIRRTVLGSLYQVMTDLVTLKPGRYLLFHDVQNGPFTTVLHETDKNTDYNLYADFESVKPEIISKDNIPQWIPIDINLITRKHVAAKRIPATFQPSK